MTKSELLTRAEVGMNALKQSDKWEEVKEKCQPYLKLTVDKEAFMTEERLIQIYTQLNGEKGTRRITDDVVPCRRVPKASELEHFMSHFMSQMKISRQMFHPIEYAAICHKRLLEICPFEKNNEGVADFVLNLLLVQGGFMPIDWAHMDVMAYEKALKDAQHPSSPKIDGLIMLITENIINEENRLLCQ